MKTATLAQGLLLSGTLVSLPHSALAQSTADPAVGPVRSALLSMPPRAHPGDYAPPRTMALIDGVITGVATTLVAVPSSLALAHTATILSPHLLGGGVPALLLMAFGPPLAVSATTTAISNYYELGQYRLWTSVVFTLPVHFGAMAAGIATGVWLADFGSLALFTLAESIVLPAVSVGMLQLFRRSTTPQMQHATHATAPSASQPFTLDLAGGYAALLPMQRLPPLATNVALVGGVF